MTIEQAKKKVLDLARAQIGYHETGENLTKYASAYDFDTKLYGFDMSGQTWCDYFVDWLFMVSFGFNAGSVMTFQYSGCSGASCEKSAEYYADAGAYYSKPSVGDQIFFYSGGGINHTGIVESVDGGYVTTIEGNSSDSVKRNVYRLNEPTIAGYGRPVWKLAQNMQYPENGETEGKENTETDNTEESDGLSGFFFSALDADGDFGPLTEETLYDFQKQYGLENDAKAGPETWKKIAELLGKEILRRGSKGWGVTALQAALNAISENETKLCY